MSNNDFYNVYQKLDFGILRQRLLRKRCEDMKKNVFLYIVICTLFIFIGNVSFAAWWGTPGYQWALSKKLTSIKTQAQLSKNVTLSDYYDIILKYLKLKGVSYKDGVVQEGRVEGLYNGAIEGVMDNINSYIAPTVEKLTPTQYRNVSTLIDHSKTTMSEYSNLLTREDLKNINLYMDLARYRAAMLLSEDTKIEREYKNNVLYSLRNTKYAASLNYGIMPMCGEMSRGAFLTLMYNLMSDQTADEDTVAKLFNDSGVLLGYDNSLWLTQNLKYSEMLTFLYRFEAFEFSQSVETPAENSEE